MKEDPTLDSLFQESVAAMDLGDLSRLEALLNSYPQLVHRRLEEPGPWLVNQVGKALNGFFHHPYLLWFVAEDPVRNNRLAPNIVLMAEAIIRVAKQQKVESLPQQLEYAVRLVAWSVVARKYGLQIPLLDLLIDTGAPPDVANEALVNGNIDAALHLVGRGAKISLATALCLGIWEEADRLGPGSSAGEKQFSLVLCALNGKAEALSRLLSMGVQVNQPSIDLFPHGTPLHHSVCSGSLDTVRILVEAGADLQAKDTVFHGTPLGWAEYEKQEEIASYLKKNGAR
jgi:hypothetical protein